MSLQYSVVNIFPHKQIFLPRSYSCVSPVKAWLSWPPPSPLVLPDTFLAARCWCGPPPAGAWGGET